jgi:glutamate-1-semialdehyde 2,1-aminomutase
VIGAGMPVGAFGGKREIMEKISPLGNVYQAGTLSGNPIAMTAGYTLLKALKEDPSVYAELDKKTEYLRNGLDNAMHNGRSPYVINQLGSMISVHFSEKPVTDFNSAVSANNTFFNEFFHAMLKKGIYLPPSAFETWFICKALTYKDIDETISAVKEFMQA